MAFESRKDECERSEEVVACDRSRCRGWGSVSASGDQRREGWKGPKPGIPAGSYSHAVA